MWYTRGVSYAKKRGGDPVIATLVNALAMLLGASVGLLLKKGIPDGARVVVMQVLGLCTIVIGLRMALAAENDVIIVLALAAGGLLGYVLRLEDRMNGLGVSLKNRVRSSNSDFVEGFVTASLITCVGAMAILGSLEAGINQDYSILFTKSVLDMFLVMVLASTYGSGVLFASGSVFLYQGAITLLSGFLAPYLTESIVAYISASGGVLIAGIGISLSGIKEIKTVTLLPGIFIAPLFGVFLGPLL